MRPGLFVATSIFALWTIPPAQAEPVFSVTDLGTDFTYVTDQDRTAHFVTDATGTRSYAFERTPPEISYVDHPYPDTDLGRRGIEQILTIKNGPFTATGERWHNGIWTSSIGWSNFRFGDPNYNIRDMNTSGQIVGAVGSSARFSLPRMKTHPPNGPSSGTSQAFQDMLTSYIPPTPGLGWLTTAFSIDERGRILAQGDNQHYYLLSPLALGPPLPVPEPTPLVTLAVGGICLGLRSIRRSRGRTLP